VAFLSGHSCLTEPGFGFIPDPWQGLTLNCCLGWSVGSLPN
jgi:hypothetical protein